MKNQRMWLNAKNSIKNVYIHCFDGGDKFPFVPS